MSALYSNSESLPIYNVIQKHHGNGEDDGQYLADLELPLNSNVNGYLLYKNHSGTNILSKFIYLYILIFVKWYNCNVYQKLMNIFLLFIRNVTIRRPHTLQSNNYQWFYSLQYRDVCSKQCSINNHNTHFIICNAHCWWVSDYYCIFPSLKNV